VYQTQCLPFEEKDVAHLCTSTEEKSLQKIVVDGWDSTEWPDGQNLLHFLCERLGMAGLNGW
jgi:hypothetical protein